MPQIQIQNLPQGIRVIDAGLFRPHHTACFLLEDSGRAAFIESGTVHSVDILLQALAERGLKDDVVDYVIVTHVHLDHAGGAGALLRRLPKARLVVHPRGARHMVDPSQLMEGARAIYGQDLLQQIYGTLVPVAQERIIEANDGSSVDVGKRHLLFLDTPGHARHHICVVDQQSAGIFSGDTFGIGYPDLVGRQGPFIFPPTTPVQFDPTAMHASIERLLTYKPQRMYLTHFGMVERPALLAGALHELVDASMALAGEAAEHADAQSRLRPGLAKLLYDAYRACGGSKERAEVDELLLADVELNTLGLLGWLSRQKRD
jgi:glyoxylase-like metal-dependent hydrolase (beta-lactamase superfamily II)